MTDIAIRIKSTYDGAGTASARKDIDALSKAAQGAGGAKPSTAGYDQIAAQARTAAQAVAGLSAEEQKAARSAEQLAQAQARTAQSVAQASAAESRAEKAALQLAQAQEKAANAAKTSSGYFQQMGAAFSGSIMGIVGPAAVAATAIEALKGAADLTVAGAQAQQTRAAFDQLAAAAGTTGNALMTAMRKASGGEISDLNLQLAANKANLLGVANSAEQLGTLMEIARDRAQKMGISTTQAFNDLVTGLGRGSALILDNLGITVSVAEANTAYAASLGKTASALTETEKKQALINAVLSQGQASLAATGGAVDGPATAFARLATAADNAKTALGGFLATNTAGMAGDLANVIDGVVSDLQGSLTQDGFASAAEGALNLTRAMGGLPPVSSEAAAAQGQLVGEIGAYLGIASSATAATQTQAGATMVAADADDRRANSLRGSIIAQQEAAAAAIAETAAKEANTAQSQLLEAQIKMVADAYIALNPNISAAGVASDVAAGRIDAAVGTYINMALATAKARAELAAIQAQAGMAGGAVEGRSERDTPADRAAAAAAGAQASRERADALATAKSQQILSTGTTKAKIAEYQRQYDAAVAAHGKESAEAVRAQTNLLQAQQTGERGRASSAASSGGRLAKIEQDTQGKIQKIVQDTQEKLLAIDKRIAAERAAAMRKLQNDMAQSSADRRAGNEADDLDLVGVKDPKEAARLNDRERAQAAARQRDQQARDEANANMANGDAETAQKIYDARQEQISKQQALDESYYARQRELAGDPAALEALQQQYDEATRAISEATDQRIAFAQAEAEQKKQAVEEEKAAVIAAAQAQADAVIAAAERSASSVKGSIASAKLSAVADLQAIGSAVDAIPSSKTVTVTVTSNASGGTSTGAAGRADGAYAGGGSFVTSGITNITVGDNPGGRELVTVTPLSGTGTTRPVPGGIAMAGGGVVDAGDGYTTPVAGGDTGGGGGGRGRAGKGSQAAADIKAQIDEQRNVIQLLSDMIALRHDMQAELENGTPFNVGFAQALARRAAEFAVFVREALPKATKDESEGYQRAADNSRDSISVLSDLIQLRKDMSDFGDINPFDVAFVERLAATGKRIVEIAQSQLIPTTEAEADRMQRWADLNGSVVGLIKDTASLNAEMFSDYVPPSDAQLNAIVRDANRIAERFVAAAQTYDTKGLEGAKQFSDAVGGTFSAFKDGLLFFEALNSGDFTLKDANLTVFERATEKTMDVAARLGAKARKIPANDLAALGHTTQLLSAQSEALIKLAAVPFGDLPGAARNLERQGGVLAGGAPIINVYPAPGMNVDQLATLVAQKIQRKTGAHR